MEWVYLLLAGIFEIAWTVGLKYTEGFTRLWPSFFTVAFMFLSFYCLSSALKVIPLGTAYAIWTGIGAAGVAILGICYFGESTSLIRLCCIALIIFGVLGLKFSSV